MPPGMQVRHILQLNSIFALLLILPFLYTATTTIPSSQATTSSPQATNHSPPTSSKGGLSPGVIAGIVTGVIIGVVLAAFFVCWPWGGYRPWWRSRVAVASPPVGRGPSSLPEMYEPQPEDPSTGDSQRPDRAELEDYRRPSELDPVSPRPGPDPVNDSQDSFHSARDEVDRDFPRCQTDLHDRIV
jgi:hypothetical protein